MCNRVMMRERTAPVADVMARAMSACRGMGAPCVSVITKAMAEMAVMTTAGIASFPKGRIFPLIVPVLPGWCRRALSCHLFRALLIRIGVYGIRVDIKAVGDIGKVTCGSNTVVIPQGPW